MCVPTDDDTKVSKQKTFSSSKHMSKQDQQDLVGKLWKDLEPDLKGQRVEHWRVHHVEMTSFGESHLSEDKIHCQFADRLQSEVYIRAKEELGDKILMKLSEPSRFEVLYVHALIKFGAEVKRIMYPEFQTDIDAIGIGAKYNVEQDIHDTEAELRGKIESKFKLELLYWSALDEQRYEDARKLLATIELMRSKSSVTLMIELLNWKLDLSLKLKDVIMFMDALRRAVGLKEYIQFQECRDLLEDGMYDLLAHTVLSKLVVVPSSFGLEQARNSGETTQSYFDEQIRQFVRGMAKETISRLCAVPDARFLSAAREVFIEKRRAFLKVNPCFEDIRV